VGRMWGGVGTQKEPRVPCMTGNYVKTKIDTGIQLDLCRHYLLAQRHVEPGGHQDTSPQVCRS